MIFNIVGNVLASMLCFSFGFLWKDFFYIKITDFIYRGCKIDGTWRAIQNRVTAKGYELTCPSIYTIELCQKADQIKGTAKAEFGIEGRREVVTYSVQGTIKDRFVCLSLRLKEKKRISHSNFLLEIKGNGERMQGFMSFYAMMSEEINSIEIYWEKNWALTSLKEFIIEYKELSDFRRTLLKK